ncbi:MAG: SMC-Scp complex subunit ScpB [Phycisphaerae bacterium]
MAKTAKAKKKKTARKKTPKNTNSTGGADAAVDTVDEVVDEPVVQASDEVENTTASEEPGQESESDHVVQDDVTVEDASPEDEQGGNDNESPTPNGIDVTAPAVVEAILFSTDVAIPASKIAQILGTGDAKDVQRHVDHLNERYEAQGSSFRIQKIAKGLQLLTLPEFNHWVKQLHKTRADSRLSAASLETLAIVAYKQPIIRADIEAIRGVAVGDMLVRLRDVNLVKIVGRAEEIGRPLLYGTTPRFLEVFGLGSLKDLPKLEEDGGTPRLRPVPEEVDDSAESSREESSNDQAVAAVADSADTDSDDHQTETEPVSD